MFGTLESLMQLSLGQSSLAVVDNVSAVQQSNAKSHIADELEGPRGE